MKPLTTYEMLSLAMLDRMTTGIGLLLEASAGDHARDEARAENVAEWLEGVNALSQSVNTLMAAWNEHVRQQSGRDDGQANRDGRQPA